MVDAMVKMDMSYGPLFSSTIMTAMARKRTAYLLTDPV